MTWLSTEGLRGILDKKYTLRFVIILVIILSILCFSTGYGMGVADTTERMIKVAAILLNLDIDPWAFELITIHYPEVLWMIPELAHEHNITTCPDNDLSERCVAIRELRELDSAFAGNFTIVPDMHKCLLTKDKSDCIKAEGSLI